MNRNIIDFIHQYSMLSPGDHVICAVSGGRDSMCLLHLMVSLAEELEITVSAAHYNHNLRGEESRRDENFVRDYCLSIGVPLAVGQRDVKAYAEEQGLGLEDAARQLRYDFLLGLSPTAKIATAHTAGDNLETLLMRLIRGCGLHGLGGIPPVRDRLIRPLLLTERREIDTYLSSNCIPHVEDSSNGEDFCLRNRLRHHVLPLLLAENPALGGSVSSLCLQLQQEDRYLEDAARVQLQKCREGDRLSIAAVKALPRAMQQRVMKVYLSPVPELSAVHIADALSLMDALSPSAELCLPGGFLLRRLYDHLLLQQSEKSLPPSPTWISPGETIHYGCWEITLKAGTCPASLPADTLALSLSGPLLIRPKAPGDRIRFSFGEKKVSRYLMDRKIPAHLRDQVPVAVFEDTIVALPPYTAAWPYGAKQGCSSLLLTVKKQEENNYERES